MKRRYFFWDNDKLNPINVVCVGGLQCATRYINYPSTSSLVFAGSLPVNDDGSLASESEEEWKKKV